MTDSRRAWITAKIANMAHGGDRKSEEIKVPKGTLIQLPISQSEARPTAGA